MQKREALFRKSLPSNKAVLRLIDAAADAPRKRPAPDSISVKQLRYEAEGWLSDCEISRLSVKYRNECRRLVDKLLWFLDSRGFTQCGVHELRQFFAYCTSGHISDAAPRWGSGRSQSNCETKQLTVFTYFSKIRTFFNWMVKVGAIGVSPFEQLSTPKTNSDQIQPFTDEHVKAILAYLRATTHSKRDMAIFLLMVDTGLRAEEVCGIKMPDIDLITRRVTVIGKGNKRRTVSYSAATSRALLSYIREVERSEVHHLFIADRGMRGGQTAGLTYSGLYQVFDRMGAKLELKGVRCSPHTCRHTFAINFLRRGGNGFTLQQILGHTNSSMTSKYVAIAQVDMDRQQRDFSPADYFVRL